MRGFFAAPVVALLIGVIGSPAAGEGASAVARVRPSVVALRVLGTDSDGFGAGVVVRKDGMVLTALHVVKDSTALAVLTHDGKEYPGTIVARDEGADLALVRIVAPGRPFRAATLGGDDRLAVGEEILAVSNPFGLGISVSRGVLSARDRRKVVPGNVAPLLQTDAAINPGSSGGALVNGSGEVVGLITAILTRTGGHQGVGFAVPAREMRRALPYLLRKEPVQRPWLGVRVTPADQGGLKVVDVVEGGPAAAAGLRAGDRLVRLAGRPLSRVGDLRAVLEASNVGDRLAADLRRADKRRRARIALGAAPRARQRHP